MFHDGTKKKGRFFKKDSAVYNSIQVTEFSFDEISQNKGIFSDNPGSNIIIERLHEDEEIDSLIKSPRHFFHNLDDPNAMPVIRPTDFTADWERERRKAKQKSRNIFDDDDDDLEFASDARDSAVEAERLRKIEDIKATGGDEDSEEALDLEAPDQKPYIRDADEQKEIAETIREHTNEISPKGLDDPEFLERAEMLVQEENTHEAPAATEDSIEESIQPSPKIEPLKSTQPDSLIDTEDTIANADESVSAQQKDDVLQDARSKGFSLGFEEGEQKAILQTREKVAEIMGHIDSIVEELSELKPAILQSAQHNFTEIAKAISEAVIGQSISLKPEIMGNIIERAIKETISEDQFSIRVHPSIFETLQEKGIFGYLDNLVKDDTIKNKEEFHIDSSITHVDGDIKKIVEEMIEEANLNIFEEPEPPESANAEEEQAEGDENKAKAKETDNAS